MSAPVSVVTITYNIINAGRKEFLRQCIESVHDQTYGNIEHIVIDGASTDGTVELIREYADKGWLTYYSEPDKGIYDAMNKGIMKATGKYIAFLNSDDFWHDPRGVEESVKYLEQEQADFSYATCYYLDENGNCMGCLKPQIGSFYVRMPFSHQTMFTKREKMLELGKFDDSLKSSADFDFIYRLILSGAKGVQIPLNFTTYRNIGFSSIQTSISINECIRTLERTFCAYGLSSEDAYKCWNFRPKKEFVEKIKSDLDGKIYEEVEKTLSICSFRKKDGCFYNYYVPLVQKIRVLYDMSFLAACNKKNDTDFIDITLNILFELLKHSELEVYGYCDKNLMKEIQQNILETESSSQLKWFTGDMKNFDIFFSFSFPVPEKVKKSGICCFSYCNTFSPQQKWPERAQKSLQRINSYENKALFEFCETQSFHEEYAQQLVQEILEQAKCFSWKNIVNELVNSFMAVNTNRQYSRYKQFAIKLFGVIPFLTIKNIGTKNKVSLFGMKLFYYE